MIKKILFLCLFSFSAIAFEMPENLSQGTFVFGKAKTNEKIFFDGKKVPIYQGMFLFALGRYAPKTIDVIVEKDGQKKTHTFDVNQKDWPKDYVTGVPDKTVNPPADVLSRINKENVLIKEARAKRFFDSFPTCFLYPLKKEDIKRISSEFGVERIYNGVPKSYHSGLDLAADEGKPVYATASGKIILAQKDLFYTGGTVLIEHGSGVNFRKCRRIDKIYSVRYRNDHSFGNEYLFGISAAAEQGANPVANFPTAAGSGFFDDTCTLKSRVIGPAGRRSVAGGKFYSFAFHSIFPKGVWSFRAEKLWCGVRWRIGKLR